MYPSQAKIDFRRYKHKGLEIISGTILKQLTTNAADFPGLQVNVGTFGGHLNAFSLILSKPDYSGKTAGLITARKLVENDLRKNGVYINELAEGDELLLAKSGYPVSRPRYPVGALPQAKFKSVTSVHGGFEVELEKIPGARAYIICTMPSKDVDGSDYRKWMWHPFANTRATITKLDSSVRYTLVAVAIGTHPSLTYSDKIEKTTQ
jgi:hypothetical protein